MRALQKLSLLCMATGLWLSASGLVGWRSRQPSGQPSGQLFGQVAKAETFVEAAGTLEVGDAIWQDGSFYDQHPFSGNAGQYVTISLESDNFDPYLILLDPSRQPIRENDDISLNNRNSRLTLRLPMTGTYTAVANSFEGGGNGGYTIQINVLNDRAALTRTLAGLAVPGANPSCVQAIASMTTQIESEWDLNALVSGLALERLYVGRPPRRNNGVTVSMDGSATRSMMLSPQLLTRLSAQLISSCASVGAVVFSGNAAEVGSSNVERTFGFLPEPGNASAQVARGDDAARMVGEFACVGSERDATTRLVWGEQICL